MRLGCLGFLVQSLGLGFRVQGGELPGGYPYRSLIKCIYIYIYGGPRTIQGLCKAHIMKGKLRT